MCIAIAKPADKKIDIETLGRCFTKNPDGAGFAYSNGGDMVIVKGLMTFDAFKAKYEEHKMDSRQGLVHFRITTRGSDGPENTHPFALKGGALIHNGTINGLGEAGKGKSDTAMLAEMLHDQTAESLERMRPLIESYTTGSRVAALYASGELLVFNERSWTIDDGVMYSNVSFRPTFATSYHATGGSYVSSRYDNEDWYARSATPSHRAPRSHSPSLPNVQKAEVTDLKPRNKPILVPGTHRDNGFFQLTYVDSTFKVGYVLERKGVNSKYIWLDVGDLVPKASLIATLAELEARTEERRARMLRATKNARSILMEMTREEVFEHLKLKNTKNSLGAAASGAQHAETAAAVGV